MTPADFRDLLGDISDCFVERDLDLWRSRLVLPLSLITKQGTVVLTDDTAVARNFSYYCDAMRMMGVDMVHRSPLSLQDCNDGTWIGTFSTELLSKGQRTLQPYTASALMTLVDGQVRISSVLNARGHHDWTKRMPAEECGVQNL